MVEALHIPIRRFYESQTIKPKTIRMEQLSGCVVVRTLSEPQKLKTDLNLHIH